MTDDFIFTGNQLLIYEINFEIISRVKWRNEIGDYYRLDEYYTKPMYLNIKLKVALLYT